MPTTGADEAEPRGERPRALYALLNLPVTATPDEIRDRYKALAILLHPDKQPDPGLKEAANRKFLQIQEAYDILSDPSRRAAYDDLGTYDRGQWAVGQKFKSAEEIRAEFDRASVLSLDARIQPRGQLAVTLDSRGLVDGSDTTLVNRLREVNIANFRVQHSVGGRLNSTTRGRLVGFSSTTTGPGSRTEYNAVATIWHQYSPKLSFNATLPILRGQRIRLKSEYQLDEATTISATTTTSSSLVIPSSVAVALQRRMFPQSSIFGAVTLQMGSQSSFTCALLSQAGNRSQDASWSVQMSISPGDASVGCRWGIGIGFPGTRASVGFLLSPMSGLGGLFEGEWTGEDTKVGLAVGSNANGMSMTFSFSRFGQEFVLPILLSDSYSLDLALMTTVIPTGLFLIVHQLAIRPRVRARLKRKHQIEMELNAQATEDARQEAIRVSAVLQPAAVRKTQHEERKNGLIILSATYSAYLPEKTLFLLSEVKSTSELGQVHDVTLVLQALVVSSQLSIPAGQSKSDIMGFYDPAPSLPKLLKVRYSYRGKLHYVEVEDSAGLVLPLRSHASE